MPLVLQGEKQIGELYYQDDMKGVGQLDYWTVGQMGGWILIIAIIVAMMLPSCAERESVPVVMPDSTIVYPAKDSNAITAKITFSRFIGSKTGRQWGIAPVFPIRVDENVYAVVELKNRMKHTDRDLMFHIDWLRPDGQSVYLKEIILPAGDSACSIESSVSSSPAIRQPGKYSLRVYLFRELIAEKYFEFRNESDIESINANIVFFKNTDKETGEMIGVDTVFEIKKKGILRARIDLSGTGIYKDEELPLRMEWYGPDGESFYSKKVEINPADTSVFFTGSISITPDKRLPGDYFLRVFLFDEIITEKGFVLNQGVIKTTKAHEGFSRRRAKE